MWRNLFDRITSVGGLNVRFEVRAGLHQGISRQLPAGTYTFGRQVGCDFVFEDAELGDNAFTLRISPNSIEIEAQQALSVEQRDETVLLQEGFRSPIRTPGEIQIAGLRIGVLSDKQTPHIGSWTARNPLATGAVAIAIIMAGLYLTAQASHEAPETSVNQDARQVRDILARRGFSDEVIVNNLGDRIELRGELATRREVEAIADELRAEGIEAELKLTDRQTVLRNVETILTAYSSHLEARWTEDGLIEVSGYVVDDLERSRVQSALDNDVAGVDALKVNINTHRDILNEMNGRLNAAGLSSKISLALVEQTIIARGRPGDLDLEQWRSEKIWYDLRYDGVLPLRSEFIDPGPVGPDIVIRAIWSGENAYLIAGDGNRYGPGAVLPGGWRVNEIFADRVVLDRNGASIELRM